MLSNLSLGLSVVEPLVSYLTSSAESTTATDSY